MSKQKTLDWIQSEWNAYLVECYENKETPLTLNEWMILKIT